MAKVSEESVVPLEQEDPELGQTIADWCNGGAKGRILRLTDQDVIVYENTSGYRPRLETHRRVAPKVGRNDPCPCGSGKKYKKCCGV